MLDNRKLIRGRIVAGLSERDGIIESRKNPTRIRNLRLPKIQGNVLVVILIINFFQLEGSGPEIKITRN